MKWPGQGAIEYAESLVIGLSRDEAAVILQKLLKEPAITDIRVKRCAHCGYPYKDRTKANMSVVCSEDCRKARKTPMKRIERARKIPEGTRIVVKYIWWLEYPFWVPEKAMFNHVGSYERPFDPEKLTRIAAARERYERMGGRRTPVRKPEV